LLALFAGFAGFAGFAMFKGPGTVFARALVMEKV